MFMFLGWHQPNCGPSGPGRFPLALIGVDRLLKRRSDFAVGVWIMDNHAFTRVSSGKGHLPTVRLAKEILRWASGSGFLIAAFSQDYPCAAAALKATGLSVEQHQRLSIHRYDRLIEELNRLKLQVAQLELDYLEYACDVEVGEVELEEEVLPYFPHIIPVLQGDTPAAYVRHIEMWCDRLTPHMWVGVGSLVGRAPDEVADILLSIKLKRPDLKLHGLGVKHTVLRKAPIVRHLLFSADTSAGGIGKKLHRSNNDPQAALDYLERLLTPEERVRHERMRLLDKMKVGADCYK